MLCDSSPVTSWKRHNRGDSRQISGGQGVGVAGRRGPGASQAVDLLCDVVMTDTCSHTCIQIHSPYSMRVTRCHLWTWVTTACPCRFIGMTDVPAGGC